jgi:hypothetical protein
MTRILLGDTSFPTIIAVNPPFTTRDKTLKKRGTYGLAGYAGLLAFEH